ncbi:MAG: HAD family phosphatase [Rhodobacteraceae bacterium]|nr:HAD family phosphatase [Paracoccaceae bacterium]
MSAVSIVVFDVGNVLIEWDPNHLYEELIPDPAERTDFLTNVCSMEWNLQQDLGRSWAEANEILIAQHPEKKALIEAYSARWHDMVPGAIKGSVDILEELKTVGVPLYAITNFSSDKFSEAKKRFPFLSNSFLDTVVSADERVLKPAPEIYEILFKRNNLSPAECVFIDDSEKNVIGARATGMHAIHFQNPDQLRSELRKLALPV